MMRQAQNGPVPVVVMGLGAMGLEIVRAAALSPEVELVGAVDVRANMVGQPLSTWVNEPSLRVRVSGDLGAAIGKRRGVVVLHATGSHFDKVYEQLLEAIRLGCSVVSTCEELAFPFVKYPELAEKLDLAAQKAGVAVLGTGVNPGFIFDRLVATVGQVCGPVSHVLATRTVDVRGRRESLQRKVGVGLSEEAFHQLANNDELGHVGLVESAALAALGVGLDCDDFEEDLSPVIAEEDISGGYKLVRQGEVAGVSQVVIGLFEGTERVRLELTMAVGVEPVQDTLRLDAENPVSLTFNGGIAGDAATANILVNTAPRIVAAEAGLLTVLELPAGR